MAETFMSAVTKIEELVTKKEKIIDAAASFLAEAILDRIRSGNLTRNSEKDIKNAIRSFSVEEQQEILTKAIIYVGMNTSHKVNNNDDDEYGRRGDFNKKPKSRSDIFGRRFDD